MDKKGFEEGLHAALVFFPGIILKTEQKLCLESLAVERKDVLGVLPTGYGKSIIYQLLPKLFSTFWLRNQGLTKACKVLVVSPLELIRNQQVQSLKAKGIMAATLEEMKSSDEHGDKEVVFGSAELWLSETWRAQLTSGSLSDAEFLVVDEVHTVETWGTGKKGKAAFRQAFGQVKDLRSFLGKKPVLALTATADKTMRQRLCKLLGFKGHKEIVISPNKENIRFTVGECDKSLQCLDWLVAMLKEKKAEAPYTIIFCHTVSDIVFVLSILLTKLGCDAYLEGSEPAPDRCILGVYYSATPETAKGRITDSFTGRGKARVVIASTSLSMGVDFPHVKYVVHFGPGRTLTEHLQQAGRAGRDSSKSFNIILYQGKHLRQCEVAIKNVIKKKDCIRKLLLCSFTDDDLSMEPIHDCCNRCHLDCKCTGEKCDKEIFEFDKLPEKPEEEETVRQVSVDDRQCLREALKEVQLSLILSTRLTLFDPSGVICHGFSDNIIESIIDNCDKIFNLTDLMEYSFISSLRIAVTVLEVLSEVFEDVTIDGSLYQLAVLTDPIYSSLIDTTASVDHQLDTGSCSDSDH